MTDAFAEELKKRLEESHARLKRSQEELKSAKEAAAYWNNIVTSFEYLIEYEEASIIKDKEALSDRSSRI